MSDQTMSFDQMRGMFARAAEVRDQEQQHLFQSLDDLYRRLELLESLPSVRVRLTELPDRDEFATLAERMDHSTATLQAQHAAIGQLTHAVGSVVNRLAGPLQQLDGRLNAMAGRMEGMAGRMAGMDDKIAGVHKRHDELDHRLDRHERRLDNIPATIIGPLAERLAGTEYGLRDRIDEIADVDGQRLDSVRDELRESTERSTAGLRQLLTHTGGSLAAALAELASRPAVDPSEALNQLAAGLQALQARLDRVEETLGARPDTQALTALVTTAHQESERRAGGQLDSAFATFASLLLNAGHITPGTPGGGPDALAARHAAARRSPNGVRKAITKRGPTSPDTPAGTEPDGPDEQRISA